MASPLARFLTPDRLAGAMRLVAHVAQMPSVQRLLTREGVNPQHVLHMARTMSSREGVAAIAKEIPEYKASVREEEHKKARIKTRTHKVAEKAPRKKMKRKISPTATKANLPQIGPLQRGTKGGTYYVSKGGEKVYVGNERKARRKK